MKFLDIDPNNMVAVQRTATVFRPHADNHPSVVATASAYYDTFPKLPEEESAQYFYLRRSVRGQRFHVPNAKLGIVQRKDPETLKHEVFIPQYAGKAVVLESIEVDVANLTDRDLAELKREGIETPTFDSSTQYLGSFAVAMGVRQLNEESYSLAPR